jgi:entericidin B
MNLFHKISMGLFGILILALTACNTMEGVGEDVQKGGEHLEGSAQRHKNY